LTSLDSSKRAESEQPICHQDNNHGLCNRTYSVTCFPGKDYDGAEQL